MAIDAKMGARTPSLRLIGCLWRELRALWAPMYMVVIAREMK